MSRVLVFGRLTMGQKDPNKTCIAVCVDTVRHACSGRIQLNLGAEKSASEACTTLR